MQQLPNMRATKYKTHLKEQNSEKHLCEITLQRTTEKLLN